MTAGAVVHEVACAALYRSLIARIGLELVWQLATFVGRDLTGHHQHGGRQQNLGAGLNALHGSRAPERAWSFPSSCRTASRSEEHTSELQSLMRLSYAVFCLKQKNNKNKS